MKDQLAQSPAIKQSYLLHGVPEDDLEYVCSFMVLRTYEKDELVYQAGAKANAIHILISGKVQLLGQRQGQAPAPQVGIRAGESFGHAALFPRKHFTETAICEQAATVAILPRRVLAELVREVPALGKNLVYLQSSMQLEKRLKPAWINPGEKVLAYTQKHPALLVLKQIFPTTLLMGVGFGGWYGLLMGWDWLWILAGAFFALFIAWDFWQFLDWQNDYYIITNQRVVWLEKVILLYDSRSEAGYDNILAVSTEMNLLGRMLNFGTVIVKTYTGQIKLRFVNRPKFFASMVEYYVQRNKNQNTGVDREKIRQTLQQKLDGGTPMPTEAANAGASGRLADNNQQTGFFGDLFKMRTEEGNTITYHKHVFGFFRDSWRYALGIIAIVVSIFFWNAIGYTIPLWFYILLVLSMVLLFFTVVYQYWDWRNDIYQVTLDQILDIDKKPLGDEDRKMAPIENILSTEYKRNGIFGLVFNFGTVFIKVGSTEFNFEDVADPPSVQQDIIQRQLGLKKRKAEKSAEADNDKMSEWLRAYHHHVKDGGGSDSQEQ